MTTARRIGCIAGALTAVVFVSVAVAVALVLLWVDRDAPATYEPAFRPKVALGDGYALVERQGFPDTDTPFVLRSIHGPEKSWEWSHEGQGLGSFTTDGNTVVGELVARDNVTSAFAFDRDAGFLFEVAGIQSYSSRLVGNGELLVRRGPELALYRVAGGSSPVWSAPLEAGAYVAFLAATNERIVAFNDGIGLAIYSRARGGAPVTAQNIDALVGIDRDREEAIALRGGRLEVLSLADASTRTTLALADAPIADSGDVPCLLGAHAGSWIIVYSTAPDTSFTGATSYQTLAERTIAAVDETGTVGWRTAVGPWNVRCTPIFTNLLPVDRELGATHRLAASRDVPAGGQENLLASVDLATGAVRWRAESQADQEPTVEGDWIAVDRGDVLLVGRFRDDELLAGLRIAGHPSVAATSADEIWIARGDEEAVRFGPDLAPGPLESTDARTELLAILSLPRDR
jgi:hypothetical protein